MTAVSPAHSIGYTFNKVFGTVNEPEWKLKHMEILCRKVFSSKPVSNYSVEWGLQVSQASTSLRQMSSSCFLCQSKPSLESSELSFHWYSKNASLTEVNETLAKEWVPSRGRSLLKGESQLQRIALFCFSILSISFPYNKKWNTRKKICEP